MEFRNLTPFDVMCFSALAPDGQEHPVIAMKVGYRLEPLEGCLGKLRAVVIDDEPVQLCTADIYYAEIGSSSVVEERLGAIQATLRCHRRRPCARAGRTTCNFVGSQCPCYFDPSQASNP